MSGKKIVTTTPDGGRVTYRSSRYDVTVVQRRGRGWRNLRRFECTTDGQWFQLEARSARQGRNPDNRTGTLLTPLTAGVVIDVTDDLRLPVATLCVVLSALRAHGRHKVDVKDIETAVSQLGWRISQLDGIDPAKRQHAEEALFTETVRRCTNV